MKKKRIVVVLGMHRSGTSAITRVLALLGVRLGENLHPASIDNPTGFWEDRDVLSINEALLTNLGYTYGSLGFIEQKMPDNLETARISTQAIDVVRKNCNLANTIWGFKDPRTARLLPFWQDVFEQAGCEVSYIIATRNPLSIVESLRDRDGFEPEKTFYLWLEHLIPSITKTKRAKRVVVDYDQLLANPEKEILRIAQALKLPLPETLALANYKNEFLKNGLRHTLFTTPDLNASASVPAQVITCHAWLEKLAIDAVPIDSVDVTQTFDELSHDLLNLLPALHFMARQDLQLVTLKNAATQVTLLNTSLEGMRTENIWLRSQREAWTDVAIERERSIAELQEHIKVLQTNTIWLESQRVAWENTATEREQSIAEQQGQIKGLQASTVWLESQRVAWENAASEREQSIAALQVQIKALQTNTIWLESQRVAWENTATEREQSIAALQVQIKALQTNTIWLESQRVAWENATSEREQSIAALQVQIKALQTNTIWLESQRVAWENAASEREQSITELQAQVQNLFTGNTWLASQRDAWMNISVEREKSMTDLTISLQESTEKLAVSDDTLNTIRKHWGIRFTTFLTKKLFK